MNIVQISERLKGVPKDFLVKEANPATSSGRYPAFLVVSELSRRNATAKQFKNAEAMTQIAQPTVTDKTINEASQPPVGIASMTPQSTPTPTIAAAAQGVKNPTITAKEGGMIKYDEPTGQETMGIPGAVRMYEGGKVSFEKGGRVGMYQGGLPAMLTKDQLIDLIREKAMAEGITDESTIARLVSMAEQESGFRPGVIGASGEYGLFQMKPKYYAGEGDVFSGVQQLPKKEDLFDPAKSASLASRVLPGLANIYDGDMDKAVAAYNLGQGNVNKLINVYGDDWIKNLPDGTKKRQSQLKDVGINVNLSQNTEKYLENINKNYPGFMRETTDATGIRTTGGDPMAISEVGIRDKSTKEKSISSFIDDSIGGLKEIYEKFVKKPLGADKQEYIPQYQQAKMSPEELAAYEAARNRPGYFSGPLVEGREEKSAMEMAIDKYGRGVLIPGSDENEAFKAEVQATGTVTGRPETPIQDPIGTVTMGQKPGQESGVQYITEEKPPADTGTGMGRLESFFGTLADQNQEFMSIEKANQEIAKQRAGLKDTLKPFTDNVKRLEEEAAKEKGFMGAFTLMTAGLELITERDLGKVGKNTLKAFVQARSNYKKSQELAKNAELKLAAARDAKQENDMKAARDFMKDYNNMVFNSQKLKIQSQTAMADLFLKDKAIMSKANQATRIAQSKAAVKSLEALRKNKEVELKNTMNEERRQQLILEMDDLARRIGIAGMFAGDLSDYITDTPD